MTVPSTDGRPTSMTIVLSRTAVRAGNSMDIPLSEVAAPCRASRSTPAMPAIVPEAANASILCRATRVPVSSAATGFAPMANSRRPNGVWDITYQTTRATTAAARAMTGTPTMDFEPKSVSSAGMPLVICRPPV